MKRPSKKTLRARHKAAKASLTDWLAYFTPEVLGQLIAVSVILEGLELPGRGTSDVIAAAASLVRTVLTDVKLTREELASVNFALAEIGEKDGE